jgi:hypothetical protein
MQCFQWFKLEKRSEEMSETKEMTPERELLEELIATLKAGQEQVNKRLANHAEGIKANREALEGIAGLVNAQTRAFNVMREVVIRLFEDRYGTEGATLPEGLVN